LRHDAVGTRDDDGPLGRFLRGPQPPLGIVRRPHEVASLDQRRRGNDRATWRIWSLGWGLKRPCVGQRGGRDDRPVDDHRNSPHIVRNGEARRTRWDHPDARGRDLHIGTVPQAEPPTGDHRRTLVRKRRPLRFGRIVARKGQRPDGRHNVLDSWKLLESEAQLLRRERPLCRVASRARGERHRRHSVCNHHRVDRQ